MPSSPRTVDDAFSRLTRWLETNAPRTRASLLPPTPAADLDWLAREFQCELPAGLAQLHAVCGGQSEDAPAGVLLGYYVLPVRAPKADSVEREWDRMFDAARAGASWATEHCYPFAIDHGGASLYIDLSRGGRIMEVDHDTSRVVAEDMASLLDASTDALESGAHRIDERVEIASESFDIVFDAGRERTACDPVAHPVLEQLGVTATIESLEEHASPFDDPPYRHGFFVRFVPREANVVLGELQTLRLVDARGRPILGAAGHGSGGGKPGFYVFVRSKRAPFPEGTKLHVQLRRITLA
jgi:cell wall assembly regulator SMI1